MRRRSFLKGAIATAALVLAGHGFALPEAKLKQTIDIYETHYGHISIQSTYEAQMMKSMKELALGLERRIWEAA